ncbi:Choline transporter-like protein ctl1 [Colletotrichum orbiculare MAFF 240422]|uniref:Protein PNS1 n=1 Tax=Colletotrichum orbiculare (strain 104-T / ATCC 96160 / CBS 514.97 / LARS 414 / MAFF 240422) TaxID=1213857 RepID=N4UWN3_COLOR|nr:Choline transporter-like protein ctl1 [Colletotrichum orbiculare MAFF 240422]
MFSEYASRFLAQSQSRLSNYAGQNDGNENPPRHPNDWSSRPSRNAGGRSFLGRGYAGNPYQAGGSRFGQIGFASRMSTAQDAPLFHSTLDEYMEEDDEDERDREAADMAALHMSRRAAAASKMAESSETEPDASRGSLERSSEIPGRRYQDRGLRRGIRSSWNGTKSYTARGRGRDAIDEEAEDVPRNSSEQGSETNPKMVDIGLESQLHDEDDPSESLLNEVTDSSPAPFQKFQQRAGDRKFPLRREATQDDEFEQARRAGSEDELSPATVPLAEGDVFKYDPFFAWIFLIAMAGLVSTFVLVWLHTGTPKKGWGDTIYTTLQASFHMLAIDTLVSILVSLVWLAALRSFARPLTTLIIVAVPIIMFSFSLYPFIASYEGSSHGTSLQDRVMRWAAIAPAISAVAWVYMAYKGRHAIHQAVEILEFSTRILHSNSALYMLGFSCLAIIVTWTWLWMWMFSRIFLGGYFSKRLAKFIISVSSWWLGVWFVLMYMWTIGIINGVQRATTAATVSQWYFHRNAAPAPTSAEIVTAAFNHASTTIFGSICESTLLALVIRAPLLVLPRRFAGILQHVAAMWIPTPITALTNPLTITYGAIHSQNLHTAARGLSQMDFLSPGRPTTTLTPQVFSSKRSSHSPLLPYRLAKMLLYATRFIMATALGFAGWVITAKQLQISLPDGVGVRGSAYAYVVGLVASFIGFSVMGAMEGILSGILDAVVICYGSERRMASGGGTYCMEAAYLFGDRNRRDERGLP